MYVCLCKGITESDLCRAVPCGSADPNALIKVLGLDDEACCGRCVENVDELVALASTQCAHCPLADSTPQPLDLSSQTFNRF